MPFAWSGLFYSLFKPSHMILETVTTTPFYLRLGIQGRSGKGKTYGALQLAYGLSGNWSKIALIDTDNHTARLYAHLGPFQTLSLGAPFTPERFIKALRLCEQAAMEVIILDSLSLEWIGEGGVLDQYHEAKGSPSDRYTTVMSHHYELMEALEACPAHLLITLRTKENLRPVVKEGKLVNEKIQVPLQQPGIDYFFTTLFSLDDDCKATVVKDKTGLFLSKKPFVLTPLTGTALARRCLGEAVLTREEELVPDEAGFCYTCRFPTPDTLPD
jgi:hypothetical protein